MMAATCIHLVISTAGRRRTVGGRGDGEQERTVYNIVMIQ